MIRKLILIIVILPLSLLQAFAHDAWLEPKKDGLILTWGHGKKRDPYKPKYVKEVRGLDCKGASVPLEIVREKEGISLSWKTKPALVAVIFDSGYGTMTTDGYQKITKREAEGRFRIVDSFRFKKYPKAMVKRCDTFAIPLGLPFEIVPLKDPFDLKAGDTLPIKVLRDGKPLEGAVVGTGQVGHADPKDKGVLKTDKDGKAGVVISNPSWQVVNASYKTKLKDDPDADTLSLCASLSFGTKKE